MQTTTQSATRDSQPRTGKLQTRPLSPALGAEILGVDLTRPLSDATFADILDCWHENLVILLRDQHLTEDDQVRFAERFGPLAISHTRRFTTANPAVMLISNVRENGKQIGALPDGEMHFHSDQCYQEVPAKGSMLYAIEIPSQGGNTLFANAYKAYETLPNRSKSASMAARRCTPTITTPPPLSAAPASKRACRILPIRWCARIRRPGARPYMSIG